MQRDRLSALEDLVPSCSNGGTLRVSYPDEVKEMLDKQNDVCGWSYCLEVSPTELGRILDRVRIVRNLDSFDADNLSTAVAKAAHCPRVRLRSPFSYIGSISRMQNCTILRAVQALGANPQAYPNPWPPTVFNLILKLEYLSGAPSLTQATAVPRREII